jgi:hypothetical protein
MTALPTTTNGLRARSDRFGGGGSCSGSSAARGLRGEMGGLSLIDTTQILSVNRGPAKAATSAFTPYSGSIIEYGGTVDTLGTRQLATRCRIKEALVPPKPNEFDSATLISRFRAASGTRSIAV